MPLLERALADLDEALAAPATPEARWREAVSARAGAVAELLDGEDTASDDAWLSARAQHVSRERERLVARLTVLRSRLTEDVGDLEPVRAALRRFLTDVAHHHQRLQDLAYDGVYLEVGGSE